MKSVLAFIALVILASTASAKPLASMIQAGGFCAEQCPTTTLTIHDNGQVIVERKSFFPKPATSKFVLATLNKKIIAVVHSEIAKATAVKLVDTNPEAPICMDIPAKTYQVVKNGQTIEIGADRDCHSFVLESYEATGLVETLKSLANLNNFAQYPID